VTHETEFLISKAFNFTEDMLIYFLDKSIFDDKIDEIERERFERNTGLGILLDYWGGRGCSRMRQSRKIVNKLSISQSYVSREIRVVKEKIGKTFAQEVLNRLLNREKEKKGIC